MNKLFEKYKKALLVFFSVGLMIVFLASSGLGGRGNHRTAMVIGHAGKIAINSNELAQSRSEWGLLKDYSSVKQQNPYTGEPMEMPLPAAMFGAQVAQQIDDKPELFMLLRHEAIESGTRVDNDQVQEILTNYVHLSPSAQEKYGDEIQQAVRDMLLVNANFERASSGIKISQPAVDQAVARQIQEIKLNVVELAASRYQDSVAVPSPEQVQKQFDKYADVAPGTPSATNPFGFGYRFPVRVRVQYLSINQSDVKKAVLHSMSSYDWDVKANLYYLQNQQNFPTTQSAEAATHPSLGPTTKPFAQVRSEVLQQVRAPMIEKLALDVQNRLLTGMQADWSSSTSATTRPTIASLQKLARSVTADTHVPVHVSDLSNDQLSKVHLAALPGIGAATSGQTSFAADVMGSAKGYLADPSKPDALHKLTKPGPAEVDDSGNIYLYRVVGAEAAHAAPNVASVRSRINSDLQMMASYDKAKSTAETLLASADKKGLNRAAVATGQTVITTNAFSGAPTEQIEHVTISDSARPDFIRQAFNLLTKYNRAKQPNPMSLIEIPQDGRVFVVQLDTVRRRFHVPLYMIKLEIGNQLRAQLLRPFFARWFTYTDVVRRLNYVLTAAGSDT